MDSDKKWPTLAQLGRIDILKRGEPCFIDYVDLMPGQPMKRPNADDRARIAKMAEEIEDFAEKHNVTFKITKGDES